jgi:hypothetical protein
VPLRAQAGGRVLIPRRITPIIIRRFIGNNSE